MSRTIFSASIVIITYLYGCSVKNYSLPDKDGKCYAKCLIQDQFETEIIDSFYYYTGENNKREGVEYYEYEIVPAHTGWVKKKADKNCISANPDDCLIWCLQEIPAEVLEIYYVVDTALIKDWEFDYLYSDKLIKAGGFSEIKEVICTSDPAYSQIVSNTVDALNFNGYDAGIANEKFDEQVKTAIIKFQKDNGLPIGQLDLETLDVLGVSF